MPVTSRFEPREFNPARTHYKETASFRRFGVELEYTSTPDQSSWNGPLRSTNFGAKTDPSVRGGEFYSPPMYGDEGLTQIDKFCQIANEHNFECGSQAGYHLHIDLTNQTIDEIKRIAMAYHFTKKMWMKLVSSGRSSSGFCSGHEFDVSNINGWRTIADFSRFAGRLNRYAWANLHAYVAHRTIEIRCHHAVRDADQIKAWVIAHTMFTDMAVRGTVGSISRIFSDKSNAQQFRELRAILKRPEVSERLSQESQSVNPRRS